MAPDRMTALATVAEEINDEDRWHWKLEFCESRSMSFVAMDRNGACGYAAVARGLDLPLLQFLNNMIDHLNNPSKFIQILNNVKEFLLDKSKRNLDEQFFVENDFFKEIAIANKKRVLVVHVDSHCESGNIFDADGNESNVEKDMMLKTKLFDSTNTTDHPFDVLILYSAFEKHYDVGVADMLVSLNSNETPFYKESFLEKELRLLKVKDYKKNDQSTTEGNSKATSSINKDSLEKLMKGRFNDTGKCNHLLVDYLGKTNEVIKEAWYYYSAMV